MAAVKEVVYIHRVKVGSEKAKRYHTYVYTDKDRAAEQFMLLGGRMRKAEVIAEQEDCFCLPHPGV